MLLSHPAFQLFSATLYETIEQGTMPKLLEKMKADERFRRFKLGSDYVPVALRWTTHPELGFPRKPFKVFRRPASYAPEQIVHILSGANEAVSVTRTFPFGADMYILAVSCTIPAGQSLRLTPLGRDNITMDAKSYLMETSGMILFKAPFMNGLLCEGLGHITGITAFPMQAILDATDWKEIQEVGFPFKAGEVGGIGYQSNPQGWLPSLVSGEEAGLMRLQLGEWLFIPPASLNAADSQVSDTTWRHPDPDHYMDFLRQDQLEMVRRCLSMSDDYSFDRNRRQISFIEKTTIPGVSQPGAGGATKDAEIAVPVVKHTVLSVSNESPAALGLGFGTYDFVPLRGIQPAVKNYSYMDAAPATMAAATTSTNSFLGYDYMVTAAYTIRPYDDFPIPFLDDLSKEIEFCALNDERARPVTPAELVALGLQLDRPQYMDGPYTESVKLRWAQSRVPHGFGMVANHQANDALVLNEPYDFSPYSYQNFCSPIPKINGVNQDAEDIGHFLHIHTGAPVPFYGSANHKYFVAGWDVFGRWTPWVKCGHTVAPPPPQQPGIMAIRLELTQPDDPAFSPAVPNVSCKLELDLGWDWIDRSPDRIEIAGCFFNAADNTPPATTPGGFAMGATDISTPVISLHFTGNDPDELPDVYLGATHIPDAPGAAIRVSIMEQQAPDAGAPPPPQYGSNDIPSVNLKRYKLIIKNVIATFTGIDPYEVAYAAYIRGLETVRVPAADWSPWKNGFVSRLADPRPPAVTTLPATIQFTAVADAAKIARGRLSWPAASGAISYNLWEASETAVRATLESKLKADFPSDQSKWLKPLSATLVDRATQLRDLLAQDSYMNLCQRSFSRVSKDPIKSTYYELTLNGSSDGLFLYRVNSVNSANIESGKSNVVFFAVPRVATPSAPKLQVRPYKEMVDGKLQQKGFEVKVVHTIGEEPLGYHLYRTRKRILSNDPGMKGLPVLEHMAAAWSDTTIDLLDGTSYPGKKMTDLVSTPGWRPFIYQAIAIGKNDPSRGRLSGESEGSSTEIAYFPPDTAPVVLLKAQSSNAFSSLFRIDTSVPFDKIDLGKTLIQVYQLGSDNTRTLLQTFTAAETDRSATAVALAANNTEAGLLPRMKHLPPDYSTGMTTFNICLKGTTVKAILRVTDPLNRATEILLES